MAGNLSNYLENKLLEHSLGRTQFALPAATYVALFTASPTDAGGGTEVSGNGYLRTAITWNPASSGSISNAADVVFPTATGAWGTIVAVGIFDAASGGNLLWYANTSTTPTVGNGDLFKLLAGNVTFGLD